MLRSEHIIAQAEEAANTPDHDSQAIRHNLDALVNSLNEGPGFSADNLAQHERYLVQRSIQRLEAQKWVQDYPGISEEKIINPVFICGLPRSGTTYLQYLFDCDPRLRLVRSWQALMPFPPPGFDPASVELRKTRELEIREQARQSVAGFDAMHLSDVDGPEECHAFLEQAYAAAGFYNLFDVPEYFDFLLNKTDYREAYRVHHRQLQLLQWRTARQRWVLKYPAHLLALDEILQVYPDAQFVMTHRDPVQILASLCKLTAALRGVRYAEAVNTKRVGQQMKDFLRSNIDRIMRMLDEKYQGRIVHVDYYQLVDDPVSAMSAIHGAIGLPESASVSEAIGSWIAKNPKGARGENRYTLEQFGLRAEEVGELFGDYTEHFAILPEYSG